MIPLLHSSGKFDVFASQNGMEPKLVCKMFSFSIFFLAIVLYNYFDITLGVQL